MEYMSQEGYDKLVAELKELEAQVPKVKDAIAEARAMGDLSENFEYHAAKRERVTITNMTNNMHMDYTIVSPHEANLRERKISIKSPIAQALLGKKAGDVVEVRVPAGMQKFRIDEVVLGVER